MSLEIGLEIEYPRAASDRWTQRGRDSNSLCNTVRDEGWPLGGRATYDGTVGLEVVSDILQIEDAPSWYIGVLDYLRDEYGTQYAPCGILANGNTAGLHMHLSPLDSREARTLFNWSQEPWMQVFACSSVSEDEAPSYRVFRSSHCNMSFDENRYACVNNRGGGHWEWRLPEPMSREHIRIFADFLEMFKRDKEAAEEFAKEMVEESDEITSVRRAQSIGEDLLEPAEVAREPHPSTERFFDSVRESNEMPYIHRVELGNDAYYAFHSTLDDTFSLRGVRFDRETILDAETLRPVNSRELRERVDTAIQNWQETSQNPETMRYLRDVVMKKAQA